MIQGLPPVAGTTPVRVATTAPPAAAAAPQVQVKSAPQGGTVLTAPPVAHPTTGAMKGAVQTMIGWVKRWFLKEAPAMDDPIGGSRTVTVRSGDSLSKIAQLELGNGNRWREIYELNQDQIANPNVIFPGQVLKLPGGGHAAPTPSPAPSARVTVQSGDTLFKIAQRTLGDGSRWRARRSCGSRGRL